MKISDQSEKRNLVSSFFVMLLIGLAFQEMTSAVRESVRGPGLSLETLFLMAVFFLNAMRFFIGNIIHLISASLARMPGTVWLYDLMLITIQSMILVFLGGLCSVEANRAATVGFIHLLILLYVVDILWITSQWFIGVIFPSWRRDAIPWPWAALNAVLTICISLLALLVADPYSLNGTALLLIISIVGYVVDVLMVDHAGILK